VSQALAGRVKQLAERYARPLPQLAEEVAALSAKVDEPRASWDSPGKFFSG